MNLSLFIMLLAFFIVLNAISTFEENKAAKVRRSVEDSFSVKITRDNEAPSVTQGKAKSINEGNSFDRVEALFKSQFSGVKPSKDLSRGVMMIDLPYVKFEKAINALDQYDLTQSPARNEVRENFFLPTLSSILQANINGAPTRMEIYMHMNDNPASLQNDQPRDVRVTTNLLGEFSRKIQSNDVPEKLINIGIAKGDPTVVRLVFRKYVPFSVTDSKPEKSRAVTDDG